MKTRMLPAAREDAQRAGDKLEDARVGYGDRFADEVGLAVSSIGANPRMFARTEDGPLEPENREYFIERFEYRVIYAIWKEEAVIVAVRHASRRPGVWISRLADIDTPEEST